MKYPLDKSGLPPDALMLHFESIDFLFSPAYD